MVMRRGFFAWCKISLSFSEDYFEILSKTRIKSTLLILPNSWTEDELKYLDLLYLYFFPWRHFRNLYQLPTGQRRRMSSVLVHCFMFYCRTKLVRLHMEFGFKVSHNI